MYHAGLGMKITFPDFNEISNTYLRKIIVENFPLLSSAGGFEFLRCIPNTKQLEPFSDLAQTNPKVLQERSHKGKVYIRPLQQDLIATLRKKPHV